MSVLQIFDQTAPLVSGYSMRSRYITESLSQLGVNVQVVSSPIYPYKEKEEFINGIKYSRSDVPFWPFISKIPLFKQKMVIGGIKRRIEDVWDHDIQVIDAHSSVLNGIAGAKMAERYKVPFIYEIRALWEDAAVDQGKTKEGSMRYNLTRSMETNIVKKAAKVTVICEGLKKDLIGRGIKENKIVVISNGVDTEKFQPIEDKDGEILDKYYLRGFKVLGFIGTFFEFEGLELLIQAAQEILKKRHDVKVLIVGGGREEARLKKLAKQLNVADNIVFTGRVRHDDIKKYYSVVDAFVYPRISKRITELVTPLKPLEAMAMEKVVIASDVGGLKELVTDGENGILFKNGNVKELVKKCLYALDNEKEMEKMAKESRQYVIKHRNWLDICKRYKAIFEELGINP